MRPILCPLCFLVLIACGGGADYGGSGVDRNKQIDELTDAERMAYCEYVIELQGGAGHTYECPDGTRTVQTVEDCVAADAPLPADCPGITVGDLEGCYEGTVDDPCNRTSAPECEVAFSCSI